MKTIAHKLLKQEYLAMAGGIASPTEDHYYDRSRRLDSLISDAVLRIRALRADDKTEVGIRSIFDEVDKVLVEANYNLYIHTHNLWETLEPGIPTRNSPERIKAYESRLTPVELGWD